MCFIFNAAAAAATDDSSYARYNSEINKMYETINTNQCLFLMQNPNCIGGGYPITTSVQLNTPNAKEWASAVFQQTQQYFNNFGFNFSGINGCVGGTGTVSPTASRVDKDYQKIINIFNSLKAQDGLLSEDQEQAIDDAIKAANEAKTPQEKLDALKEGLRKIGSDSNIQAAVAKLAKTDRTIKVALYNSGYDFSSDSDIENDLGEGYSDLTDKANEVVTDFKTWSDGAFGTDLSTMLGSQSTILTNLHYLNRAHNTEGGFIKLLVSKYKDEDGFANCANNGKDEINTWKGLANKAYSSLKSKADKMSKYTMDADTKSKLDNAVSKLKTAHDDFFGNSDNWKDDAAINEYATLYNNVYKMVRMIDAKCIDNEIKDKYKCMNDTVPGLVPDNQISDATKDMLKDENLEISGQSNTINVDDIDVSSVKNKLSGTVNASSSTGNGGAATSNPGEAMATRLTNQKLLTPVSGQSGVYESTNGVVTGVISRNYYYVNGENLVELKNVKSYNVSTNKFIMADDTEKSLDEIKDDSENTNVDESATKTSINFRKKLFSYMDEDSSSRKLTETETEGTNGEIIITDLSGDNCFVVLNDKLYKIEGADYNGDLQNKTNIKIESGKVTVGSSEFNLKEVTNWSDINNL